MMYKYLNQLFEIEANTNVAADFEPAISIDHTSRIVENINTLREALGITDMTPMAEGTVIKRYKTTVTKAAGQVAEGEVIPLSKTERKPLPDLTLSLSKYRKLTTAEAIQKYGKNRALNESDEKLTGEIRKDVKKSFFALITGGTGVAAGGGNLQVAAAQAWGALQVYYEDTDVTPVFFVNPLDVATYLGEASITTQTAFGFSYIEGFLGMGNAFITPQVTQGTVYATVTENLNGVYVPASGDVADVFGLTFDDTGLIGMNHSLANDRASVQTLIMSGVMFFPEDASGVFASKIGA